MFIADGQLIDGKFQVRGIVGRGGMGIVYEASQIAFDRIVAVKLLSSVPEDSQDELVRFKREAVILSKLSHPNIVQFYGYGIWNGLPYIAMERLVGESLQKLLAKNEPLKVLDSIEYVRQICDGLEHAYAHGIIHRDLKPSNIILSIAADGRAVPRIIDFGLAKLTGSGVQKLTQTNTALGSVQYMSPEQCTGKAVDQRSDIYSLGCLLYHCLTGDPPYCADNAVAVMFQQVNDPVQNTPGWNRLPGVLQDVLARCLAKDPAERFQSWAELREVVNRAAQSESVVSATLGPKNSAVALMDNSAINAGFASKMSRKLLVTTALAAAFVLIAGGWYITQQAPSMNRNSVALNSVMSPKEIMTSLTHRDDRDEKIPLSPAEIELLAQATEQVRHDPASDPQQLMYAYEMLSIVYVDTGEREKLRTVLSQAVEVDPRATTGGYYSQCLRRYHDLCVLSGCELSLVGKLEAMHQNSPRDIGIAIYLAQDYAKLGRDVEARKLLLPVLANSQMREQLELANAVLKRLDDKDKTIKQIKLLSLQLDKQIKAKKSTASTVFLLERCYRRIDKDPSALILQELSNPADLPFDKLILRCELGKCYQDNGDNSRCEAIWNDVVEPLMIATHDRQLQVHSTLSSRAGLGGFQFLVLSGLAQIYLEAGRYRECRNLLEKFSSNEIGASGQPWCSDVLLIYRAHACRHLGLTVGADKLYEQAIWDLDRAAEKNKKDITCRIWRIEAQCGLASSLYRQGKYQKGPAIVTKAAFEAISIVDTPRLACCQIVRAGFFEKLNRVSEAQPARDSVKVCIASLSPGAVQRLSYLYDDVVPVTSIGRN